MVKTRIAYGYHNGTGKLYILGDTIELALKAKMLYREYEKQLIAANPQLEITFKIEKLKVNAKKNQLTARPGAEESLQINLF